MLLHFLLFVLLANLSAACLDCPSEDGDRGKVSLSAVPDEDYLKVVALAGRALPVAGSPQQYQKGRLLYPKGLAQRIAPFLSMTGSVPSMASVQQQQQLPSNLLHVYTLLNKASAVDPRLVLDDYYLQDSAGLAPLSSRLSKKAEKGMLVDVVDYVSKTDDRNRRVGQNMRSSG